MMNFEIIHNISTTTFDIMGGFTPEVVETF